MLQGLTIILIKKILWGADKNLSFVIHDHFGLLCNRILMLAVIVLLDVQAIFF